MFEFGVAALAVGVELGEYVVPDFHEAVAVTAGLAVRRAASVLQTAVEVDFGAGAAGTGTVFPEVVGLAETYDAFCGYADLLVPEFERFIVFFVDGRIEEFFRDFEALGKEFPCPRNRLILEVVAEGEVAEHFEVGTVTRGVAYAFQVRGTDALLAGGNALARRFNFAGEELLHRSHTGVDEKKGFVVLGNERERRESEMTLGFKEREIFFSQIVN